MSASSSITTQVWPLTIQQSLNSKTTSSGGLQVDLKSSVVWNVHTLCSLYGWDRCHSSSPKTDTLCFVLHGGPPPLISQQLPWSHGVQWFTSMSQSHNHQGSCCLISNTWASTVPQSNCNHFSLFVKDNVKGIAFLSLSCSDLFLHATQKGRANRSLCLKWNWWAMQKFCT